MIRAVYVHQRRKCIVVRLFGHIEVLNCQLLSEAAWGRVAGSWVYQCRKVMVIQCLVTLRSDPHRCTRFIF